MTEKHEFDYKVGAVQVSPGKLYAGCLAECRTGNLVLDTLGINLNCPSGNNSIEHKVWMPGSQVVGKYVVTADMSACGTEDLAAFVPDLMRYIATTRAAQYDESNGRDPAQYKGPQEKLLDRILEQVAGAEGVEVNEELLRNISPERFVLEKAL